ncbi:hypothetical protein AVEN_187046-1 [Araneus ventricosus]|uniref:Uncharacterized protein n=1 Tax=Araneus ventricosus TaxID=182803 RepID=A0A4Y2JHW2_ARAVE|nr:hypothetical protein AVEN_187046-1 [Araneus ventricosus]
MHVTSHPPTRDLPKAAIALKRPVSVLDNYGNPLENAWEGVTKRTLISPWKKLWSVSVVECDIEESQTVVEPIINEIVSLDKIRRLAVDTNAVNEIVEEHNQELTTEELMELHCVSQQEVRGEFVR